MKRHLVTGAGGFIGNHLVSYLKDIGCWVAGVDLKYPSFSQSRADDFMIADLRDQTQCLRVMAGMHEVYACAADMGGMGFIADPQMQAEILYNNTLINLNSIEAARKSEIRRYLFTSSVCVYPTHQLATTHPVPLREQDVYPALPQASYGWEKLQAEHFCTYYQSYGLQTRIARLQNCYGPLGAWHGGREKAPAALSRKIAVAKLTGNPEIEIWGDGEATRVFMYVSDCVRGIYRLMQSDYSGPVTLGPDRAISINDLADLLASIAGIEIIKKHTEGPEGVRGRAFDHTVATETLKWQPAVSLEEGLAITYKWVEGQVYAYDTDYAKTAE